MSKRLSGRTGIKIPANRKIRVRILILILLALFGTFMISPASAAQKEEKETAAKPWSVSLQTKYIFRSHTSYEFGNPFSPYQVPLSRLEFPLDSWWAGASLRRQISRFSVGVEMFRNISGEAGGIFRDSDWDDDERPDIKTIYSESKCALKPSYMVNGDVDLQISDWIGLPRWFDLRPTVGVRWQQFSFVTHNGIQSYPEPGSTAPPTLLPGNGISFEQTYWQFFAGFKTGFDLGRPFRLSRLNLNMQFDWAYVYADNEDYHILKPGHRLTYDTTTGNAWHTSVNLKIGLTQNLNANIGAEYLYIKSTGTHRLLNEPFGIDFKFSHGVKVWSEQKSVTLGLEYTF